jgi:thiol-disulfide isomerase/thioredoxin
VTTRMVPATILVLFFFAFGCNRTEKRFVQTVATEQSSLPQTVSLNPGDPLPPFAVGGWIHGPRPELKAPGSRLQVVDVWAAWCPYCRESAPGLVRLHQKYADRGVRFVSVTNMGPAAAKAFVDQFKVPWPNGYGLTDEAMTALGASSGMAMSGYEIAPVLYLVDREGRIRWTDRQGRFRHVATEEWERKLDEAIEAALQDR